MDGKLDGTTRGSSRAGRELIPANFPRISALEVYQSRSTVPVLHPQSKAMPADDYTAAVSGGLKLKGVNTSGKVSKSHKKKRPKPSQPESSADASAEKSKGEAVDGGEDVKDIPEDATIDKGKQVFEDGEATPPQQAGKTEAELRHEERRRKRVCYIHLLLSSRYLLHGWGNWLNEHPLARRAPKA